jgi:hypothetical protein
MNIDPTFDDDALSSAMGTETLVANDMVPEGMQASRNPLDLPMQRIGGVRYLRVEGESASRRSGSKVSKIWQYGTELRAFDTPNLDKYFLCDRCLPATQLYSLADSVVEALECLKAWWEHGFVRRD